MEANSVFGLGLIVLAGLISGKWKGIGFSLIRAMSLGIVALAVGVIIIAI